MVDSYSNLFCEYNGDYNGHSSGTLFNALGSFSISTSVCSAFLSILTKLIERNERDGERAK